ncbi:hypothetical protein HNR46_002355 [Haloferula luteola]|uniref:DUF432 domain-containing protein n=1 Tax=Haloferula luteola TaxID=595692 RepID=A0A840V945_9BACT|nr:DUF432 domain-containing protein [Haloferula luteola]MBB5352114.1 hypothetical protein [Haloferula luteola]
MSFPSPWHERTLEDGEWLCADFADLCMVVHSTMEEWRVATVDGERGQRIKSTGRLPEDLEWERWDRGVKDRKLAFRPVFPDRPVIVRPRSPLHLSPRAKALFYVGIPARIELSADLEGTRRVLSSWPSVRLSNSWHGLPTAGQLCYASRTQARRRYVTDEWKAFDIATTVEISNQSEKTLPFERLFFETDHLAIFLHGSKLWSNHARIRITEADEELNGVVFSAKPYGDASDAGLLSAARRGIVRRSFLRAAFSTVLGTFQDD